jgi:hypothetical protein
MEHAIPQHAQYYDASRAEALGIGWNEHAKIKTVVDKRDQVQETYMKSIHMQSRYIQNDAAEYGMVVVRDDKVVLTRVRGVYAQRPALDYFDKIEEKKRAAQRRILETEVPVITKPTKQKALQVQVQTTSEVDAQLLQKKSQIEWMREEADEVWRQVTFHDVGDAASAALLSGMVSPMEMEGVVESTKEAYMHALLALETHSSE